MNLLKRSSSWLWPGGHGLLVPASASFSFSSWAEEEEMRSPHQRFPFLWRSQKDLENMEPERMRRRTSHPSSSSYHSIFHRLQALKLECWPAVLHSFNTIPQSLRDFRVYSLLSAVESEGRHLGNAHQLKRRGVIKAEIPFDVSREVDCVKLDLLMHQYKQINKFTPTCNTRLYAYAAISDFEGMDKFLTKMESDPGIKTNYHTYVIAANGYLEAGLADQAVKMMNKSDKLLHEFSDSYCFETLVVFYTEIIMDKAHVHRIWNLYKETGKGRFDSSCYMCMISSLLRFDDLDGAEKIFEEWDLWLRTVCLVKFFEIRIPNMMIEAYSRKGLWEKAEAFMKEKIVESGNKPDSASWDHLAAAYLVGGEMTKAVEAIKKAFLASSCSVLEWRWEQHMEPISLHTMYQCFKYLLLGKGDGAREAQIVIWDMITRHPHFLEMTGYAFEGEMLSDMRHLRGLADSEDDIDDVVLRALIS